MPVLHIGDIEIVAHAQQLTSPALHIKNADGEIYHVAVMPVGGGAVLTGFNAIDGGDGGSGSTGTSNISFLRIYKM